jgi:hypothetical protein
MSRYAIDAKNPGYFAVVGYDRPLNHFFGEVHDAEGELVAETDFMNGVKTVGALVAFMAPHADISADLAAKLLHESQAPASESANWNRQFNLKTRTSS